MHPFALVALVTLLLHAAQRENSKGNKLAQGDAALLKASWNEIHFKWRYCLLLQLFPGLSS